MRFIGSVNTVKWRASQGFIVLIFNDLDVLGGSSSDLVYEAFRKMAL